MTLWIITGSATEDGAPIYLQACGRWARRLSAGHPVMDENERQALLDAARTQQRVVCDPYPIEVRRSSHGELAPTTLREKIRAMGPTTPLVGASDPRPVAASA